MNDHARIANRVLERFDDHRSIGGDLPNRVDLPGDVVHRLYDRVAVEGTIAREETDEVAQGGRDRRLLTVTRGVLAGRPFLLPLREGQGEGLEIINGRPIRTLTPALSDWLRERVGVDVDRVLVDRAQHLGLGLRQRAYHVRQLPPKGPDPPAKIVGTPRRVTTPEWHARNLAGRRLGDDAIVSDLDRPPDVGAKQEGVAGARLKDELLVKIADPGPSVVQDEGVGSSVRDRASAADGGDVRSW